MRNQVFILLSWILGFVLSMNTSVYACSCNKEVIVGTQDQVGSARFELSDGVFDGVISDIKSFNDGTLVMIDIQKVLKGAKLTSVNAFTGTGGGDCGISDLLKDIAASKQSYRFYGFGMNPDGPPQYWLTMCAPPIKLEEK